MGIEKRCFLSVAVVVSGALRGLLAWSKDVPALILGKKEPLLVHVSDVKKRRTLPVTLTPCLDCNAVIFNVRKGPLEPLALGA